MTLNRRKFIGQTAAVAATGAFVTGLGNQASANRPTRLPDRSSLPAQTTFVATWPFGKQACEAALKIFGETGSMLDAIERGIWVTESDASNASVGIGGIPNAAGAVELDACIMSGPNHQAGSVAGVQNILHPISVARAVMEKTPHVMLVGEGAYNFAIEQGFEKTNLLTEQQRLAWEQWKASRPAVPDAAPQIDPDHHDTIAMLGLDEQGNLFGGCSTSGWGYKIPGRVGDSPIIGGGLYVDNAIGAAGATGLGENVMRHCGSFVVVEMMRNGAGPTEACEMAIRRIAETDPKGLEELEINFIALNKAGEFGAAGTSAGFQYAVTNGQFSRIIDAKSLSAKSIGPEGGNRK